MSINNHTRESTPPPTATLEEQRVFWEKEGVSSLPKKGEDAKWNKQRKCHYCGSEQDCTGPSICTVCGHSLKGAKRTTGTQFDRGLY